MEKIKFEDLPQAMSLLLEKVDSLTLLLESKSSNQIAFSTKPLSIQEAAIFLKLSVPTIYSLVSRREIPFSKVGKRLYFTEPDLNEWIKSGRQSSGSELITDSPCILTNRRTRK